MVKAAPVTVEVRGPNCESLLFRPLMERVRGRFDCRSLPNPGDLIRQWPEPIPGQRIRLDVANRVGAILEPLHGPDHAATRDKITAKGWKLPEAEVRHEGVDVPTWLFFMRGAVDCGLAEVVEGELPDTIEGTPQTEFITKRQPDPIDRLVAAMEKQNELLAQIVGQR